MKYDKPIVLMDGECNLCNNLVQFIINHDTKGKLLIASLQSDIGHYFLQKFNFNTSQYDTFVLIEGGKCYTKSTAGLRVALCLNKLWPLFYVFIIVPPFIRNAIYDFIAKNRVKWFGKSEMCMYPSEEMRKRFIDGDTAPKN